MPPSKPDCQPIVYCPDQAPPPVARAKLPALSCPSSTPQYWRNRAASRPRLQGPQCKPVRGFQSPARSGPRRSTPPIARPCTPAWQPRTKARACSALPPPQAARPGSHCASRQARHGSAPSPDRRSTAHSPRSRPAAQGNARTRQWPRATSGERTVRGRSRKRFAGRRGLPSPTFPKGADIDPRLLVGSGL